MQMSILKFVALVAGSAFIAVLCILRDALRIGKDPSNSGLRALISEFLGFWIGSFFLLWSFTVDNKFLQWMLRGVAAIAAIESIRLSYFFRNTNELRANVYTKSMAFKNDITRIHLKSPMNSN